MNKFKAILILVSVISFGMLLAGLAWGWPGVGVSAIIFSAVVFCTKEGKMKYKASSGIRNALGEEGIADFLDYFAAHEPWDSVKFVHEKAIRERGDDIEEMYSCSNGNIIVLVFPMIDDFGGKYVSLMLESECPGLDGLHKYGNSTEEINF